MFPKDESMREIWLQKCGKKPPFRYNNSFICSKHFKEEDFERDVRREFLDLPVKMKLKADAIPSLNLDDQDDESDNNDSSKNSVRKQRYALRERKKYIEDILSKKSKNLKRSTEVDSTTAKIDEPPAPKKLKETTETTEESQKRNDEIDAAELQTLLNIVLERVHSLEEELVGLDHIMKDIKGRIDEMLNRH